MGTKNNVSNFVDKERTKSYNSGVLFGSRGLAATLLLVCYDKEKSEADKLREIEKECRKLI